MFKGLSRLLLGGMVTLGKAQLRQQKQLGKALLGGKGRKAKPAGSKPGSKPAMPKQPRPVRKAVAGVVTNSPALPGQWLSSWYSGAVTNRPLPLQRLQYRLYLPRQRTAQPLPLLVMLHGCDQDAASFAQGTRMNALAEQQGFAVLYPQQALRRHAQRCWPWYDKALQQGGGEVQLIMGAIDKVLAQHGLDRSRVYVAGISAGAAMAHVLALNHPDRIAAVGLHSGPVYGAGHGKLGALMVMQGGSVRASGTAMADALARPSEALRMPAILLHGHDDKVVRPINQQQLAQQFIALNGLQYADARPTVLKHSGRGRAALRYQIDDYVLRRKLVLRVCRISALGHAWSGGDGTVKYHAAHGPDASRLMWDFFARHRRSGAVVA